MAVFCWCCKKLYCPIIVLVQESVLVKHQTLFASRAVSPEHMLSQAGAVTMP